MVTFWRLPEGSDAVRWARLGNKPRTLLLRELAVLLAAISSGGQFSAVLLTAMLV